MSKRYYLSPVIGTGTKEDPYRAKVADVNGGQPLLTIIPRNNDPASPNYGKPLFAWAFCIVGGNDHNLIQLDASIDPLPSFALDGKLSAINGAAKTRMFQALQRRGIDTTTMANRDGYREVIRDIGTLLDAKFNEDTFDFVEASP